MIFYITTKKHRHTLDEFLATWGKELVGTIVPVGYETLFRMHTLPVGSYIFADLERLSPEDLERAALVWTTLSSSGRDVRLFNHPLRAMRRYELLREMRERDINDFDVYRLTEARRPSRFPVFIRLENDHNGSITKLLHSPRELDAAIERLTTVGCNRDTLLITEFNATTDQRGLYRKYGAFAVGERIIPRHLLFSRHWQLKYQDFVDDATTAEEWRFLRTNPHEEALQEIFAAARIDYGRIDYSVVDGRIQVFEINTNPLSLDRSDTAFAIRMPAHDHFARDFIAALKEADSMAARRPRIPVDQRRMRRNRMRPSLIQEAVCVMLQCVGLRRYQSLVLTRLRALRARSRRTLADALPGEQASLAYHTSRSARARESS
jgi:hypothetical protein